MDQLLWEVLWEPLLLPRDVRQSFQVEGNEMEVIAKSDGFMAGGLVAVFMDGGDVDLRHLAVRPEAQRQGIGNALLHALIETAQEKDCRRIHTIARNNSATFFRKSGFNTAPGTPPTHPLFEKHGITFELLELLLH